MGNMHTDVGLKVVKTCMKVETIFKYNNHLNKALK